MYAGGGQGRSILVVHLTTCNSIGMYMTKLLAEPCSQSLCIYSTTNGNTMMDAQYYGIVSTSSKSPGRTEHAQTVCTRLSSPLQEPGYKASWKLVGIVEARILLLVEAVPPSLPLVEEYSPKSIHGLKAKVFVCRGRTR